MPTLQGKLLRLLEGQQVLLKLRYAFTTLHGVTSPNTLIFRMNMAKPQILQIYLSFFVDSICDSRCTAPNFDAISE